MSAGSMDDYRSYVAANKDNWDDLPPGVEPDPPPGDAVAGDAVAGDAVAGDAVVGGMEEYRAFVAAKRKEKPLPAPAYRKESPPPAPIPAPIYIEPDEYGEDASTDVLADSGEGLAISKEEHYAVVKPRLGRRSIPIAKAVFTPEGMVLVGAHPTDDPVLLLEVWCLNRGKTPLDPITLKSVAGASIIQLMNMSPAFNALRDQPDLRAHYAPAGAAKIVLWRNISRLARTYWTQYALHAAIGRDRKLWGFPDETPDRRVVYECDTIIDFLLLNFPKERKVYLWPALPAQPESPIPTP